MKFNRTKNTVRNVIFGSINRILNIFLPFISRTIILYYLGTQYLGLSSLFTSILSFLSLTELGIGGAMTYSMYKPIAEDDEETICALLNLYRKFYRLIGTIILVLGLCLMPFLRNLINGSVPDDINLQLLYFLYLLNTVISYWMFAYKTALLQAHQRNDIESNIASFILIVSYIVQLSLLMITRNYYYYVVCIPIFTIITNLIRSYFVNKLFPNYKPRGEISIELKKSITKKVAALFGTKLNTVVLNAADNLVLSAFLGLTVITIYNNYYYIMSSVWGFLGIVYSSMLGGIGNSIATDSVEKNYEDFMKFSFLNSWIVGWCAVCLICLFQPFMELWVGKDLMFPMYVVLEMALYFYIYQIRKIAVTYKDAAGIWWEDRFRPYVSMIINLGLNIWLVQIIGISGIILSTIISLMVSIPWENYTIFRYMFHKKSKDYYLKMLYYFICMIIACIATYLICSIFGNTFLDLILRGIVCVIIPNIIFILMNYTSKEYKDGINIIKRITSFKRG